MEAYVRRLYHFISPLSHFGDRNYSYFFPLVVTLSTAVILEMYVNNVLSDPEQVGFYAIFIFIILIIYFSLREAILGGFISSSVTIAYYLYIIYSRNYTGEQLNSSIQATIFFALIYFIMSGIIGGLKQRVDELIQEEVYQKRHLESIIQQLPVGVVIANNKGKVVQVNRQMGRILGRKIPLGFTIAEDRPLIPLYSKNSGPRPFSPLLATIAGGKAIRKEYTAQRADGKLLHIRINTSVIRDKENRVTAVAAIVDDVTQEKELDRRKDDFVNIASHELKTPLTSMKLYIESLLRRLMKSGDSKEIKMISSIKYQTDRLQELVRDLLDVSRLQTGKLTFNRERFRLDELIEETVEQLKETAGKRTLQYLSKNQIPVYADKFRIYQVLTNLITNAIKYSPDETDIIIKLSRKNGKAVVSVRDYGIGIAKDHQRKIFNRLYQVGDDDRKTFPGLGMGLYISATIIKRHRGTMKVESQKGKGSTFYFTLPIPKK
ncbi:PAS domain S-box protein [Candidatus Roizmanbacteria bacterium]|nr:PAS domain S-box protein [Candidatus Roizmanbacteria bacterium]